MELSSSGLFYEINMVNYRRKVGSKFPADASFIRDKTPVTIVMQREKIKILVGCSVDQQKRNLKT
jgi:hypothetical protein